jgi:hypothetical protein
MRLASVRIFVDDLSKARGVPMHGLPEKQYWGGIMLFAQDPAGNTITFIQYPAEGAA